MAPNPLPVALLTAALLPAAAAAREAPVDVFPFQVFQETLDNGLQVMVVPYDSPGVLAYYTVVRTGSRDEVEEGHSGFAHFFEHMMFRGTDRYPTARYNETLKRIGADSNAYTSDDLTCYSVVGPAAELETIMELEADRFQNLNYSEDDFRTESLAVLGEYNKTASNPQLPLYETVRGLAFQRHTYRHTTLGFLADIQAMPGYYDYSLSFFRRFYRPENSILLVVGDADPQRVFDLARRLYGAWEPGYAPPAIPAEPPQSEERREHIRWSGPTRPYLMVGYHVPAFSTAGTRWATVELINELLFSESAPLYRELVVDKQWVDELEGEAPRRRDPNLLMIQARARSAELLPEIEATLDRHLAALAAGGVEAERLENAKAHLRHEFAARLDSPTGIGYELGRFLSLTGEAGSVNELFARQSEVTAEQIRAAAGEIFRATHRTAVTLAHGPAPEAAEPGAEIETVTLPDPASPLVAVRLMFAAGSMYDPPGKEGLAALTGLMLARAGTSRHSYEEITELLYPLAASFEARTDREVTLISGQVHRDALPRFTALLTEALLEPGFAAEDLERNRAQLSAALSALRSGSDEDLGLEAIQQAVFHDHPYGHAPQGTDAGLAAITLEDIRDFYRRHYTRGGLVLGVAGGYGEGYAEELRASLSALPAGNGELPAPPPAPAVAGRRFTLVAKQTAATGIHLAFPLEPTRADDDFYPLLVALSYFGEHRTSYGRLMIQMRELRGLNYGDYAYPEYYYDPPGNSTPTPNVPRRRQYFSIWVRPVARANAHFALRAALYELERLTREGLTEEQFEATRDFLIGYSKSWVQRFSDRLGVLMDSRYYGMDPFIGEIEGRLRGLTVGDVNRAIRRHLRTGDLHAVLITGEAEALADALRAEAPSPIRYANPVPPEVLEADREIQVHPVRPTTVEVVPAEGMF